MQRCIEAVKIVKDELDKQPNFTDEESIFEFITKLSSRDIDKNYLVFFEKLIEYKGDIKNDLKENEVLLTKKILDTNRRTHRDMAYNAKKAQWATVRSVQVMEN